MSTRDPRIDAYIARSAEFARPILEHLRGVVHQACPDVEETLKWGFPHFSYQGLLCGMAAFKQHAVFGFWKGTLLPGVGAPGSHPDGGMGQFGRLTAVSDLPSKKVLIGHVKAAMKLNEEGGAKPQASKPRVPKKDLPVPDDLAAALKKNKPARATFEAFSPSHRREYIEWITDAKRAETRERRIAQTIEQLAEGKDLNWKYARPRSA